MAYAKKSKVIQGIDWTPGEDAILKENAAHSAYNILSKHKVFKKNKRTKYAIMKRKEELNQLIDQEEEEIRLGLQEGIDKIKTQPTDEVNELQEIRDGIDRLLLYMNDMMDNLVTVSTDTATIKLPPKTIKMINISPDGGQTIIFHDPK
jgi:hypothetical protein